MIFIRRSERKKNIYSRKQLGFALVNCLVSSLTIAVNENNRISTKGKKEKEHQPKRRRALEL